MFTIRTKAFGTQNKDVIFFLSGWTNLNFLYYPAAVILSLNGYCCIVYTYDRGIVTPDSRRMTKNVDRVKRHVLSRIRRMKQQGYRSFSLFGVSLGAILSVLIANESPDVSKVILNTVAADLAECIWNWNSGIALFDSFKDRIRKRYLTLFNLKMACRPISPIYHVENLHRKKLLIFLSRKDQLLPFSQGMKLVRELRSRYTDIRLVTSDSFEHAGTCVYNIYNPRIYLPFLKES